MMTGKWQMERIWKKECLTGYQTGTYLEGCRKIIWNLNQYRQCPRQYWNCALPKWKSTALLAPHPARFHRSSFVPGQQTHIYYRNKEYHLSPTAKQYQCRCTGFHKNANIDFHLPAWGLQIWETEYWAHHDVSRNWGRETRKEQSTLLTTENQIRIIRNCKHHIELQLNYDFYITIISRFKNAVYLKNLCTYSITMIM